MWRALDACLRGGLPRGQLSELAGPRSSGRMTLLLQMMAAATRRGEIAALVDTLRSPGCGVGGRGRRRSRSRLLWIRGQAITAARRGRLRHRCSTATLDRALKALNLVLQAGGFGVVAIDLADVPLAGAQADAVHHLAARAAVIEGSDTACVLVASEPLARSAGGLTLSLPAARRGPATSDRSRRLPGSTSRRASSRRGGASMGKCGSSATVTD